MALPRAFDGGEPNSYLMARLISAFPNPPTCIRDRLLI